MLDRKDRFVPADAFNAADAGKLLYPFEDTSRRGTPGRSNTSGQRGDERGLLYLCGA